MEILPHYHFSWIVSFQKQKEKVKFTLEQAMKAKKGNVEVYLYSSFNLRAGWGWVVDATPRLSGFQGWT